MTTATLDEDRLKELFKSAIIEVLEERKDLIRELIEEAMEDVGLIRAIQEGEHGAKASRQEVFEILEGA